MKSLTFKYPLLMIAHSTFQEARHSRVLHLASFFAVLLILFSLFMGEVSLYQNEKVVKDIGLFSISFLGVFVAIFLGVNSLYKELEQRTIYSIMAKPITRSEILLGKYLGMASVLFSVVLSMTGVLYLVTGFLESRIDLDLMPAIGLIYAELLIVAAIAIFFSSFSSPFLSAFFSSGVFLVGRISRELADFGERSKNEIFKFFATGVQKVFDLEAFNLRTAVVHKFPVYVEDFWWPLLYAGLIVSLLLLVSQFVFIRRDFK